MEVVAVVAVLALFLWWMFKFGGSGASASAIVHGIPFKEIEAESEWRHQWRTFAPSLRKPESFYQNHVTALFESGGIAIFQSVLPASTRASDWKKDGFKLLAEHLYEAGDRIEVRDLPFQKANYDWISQQGGGGFWKVHPHNERGAAVVLFKSSGHISKLVELVYVGADMDAANIAADLRAALATVVPTPDTPPPVPQSQARSWTPEGFDL